MRTCHYSDDPRWYELCDEYGIYLIAEANLECHGLISVLCHEPRMEKMWVDRNVANVENFKNRPSLSGRSAMKVAMAKIRSPRSKR